MIEFDYSNADIKNVGSEHGLDIKQKFDEYRDKIVKILVDLNSRKDKPGQWLQWMNLGYSEETAWYVKEYASLIKGKFDNLLILGVGGNALGGQAVCEALLHPYWNLLTSEQRNFLPRVFFLDNIDTDQMNALLETIDLSRTLVNVITKSGSTAETMAQFMILKDRLEQELGESHRENIVATTDARMGVLRQLAEQEGYKTFVVPDDVAGRFSVFSAVGLLPFALVGIDIDEMMLGIKKIDLLLKNTDIDHNIAAQNALIHYLMDTEKKKDITVMMPYSSRLKYLPNWFSQLWAESLSKTHNRKGEKVNIGQTPVKCVGVTDQHSLMQLFSDGPNNKIFNFVRISETDTKIDIPEIFEYTGVGYLGGKPLKKLFEAEADATIFALTCSHRPNVTITIPHLTPFYMGQLLYLFEMQTSIAGELYDIEALEQVRVEETENYVYGLMGRAGYEESALVINEKIYSSV